MTRVRRHQRVAADGQPGSLLATRVRRWAFRRPARRLAAGVAAAAVLALAATGCGASGQVAAEVAGVQYEVEDLNAYLASIDDGNPGIASRGDTAAWLSNWVFFTASELELIKRGAPVADSYEADAVADLTEADDTFVPGAPGGDIRIRQQAVIYAAREWAHNAASEIIATGQLRHLCSRHILVPSQQAADDVMARLDGGEAFEDLALDLSEDVASGSLGGDLGCVIKGAFVAEFERAAYAAAAGETVVAESQFGFHVIEVISAGPPTADHHPQLDAQMLAQMQSQSRAVDPERVEQDLLVELANAVRDGYADRVWIRDRYGTWDSDLFAVVVDPA